MSAEIVTVDLTTAREAAYQGRHRRPVDTDRRAAKGIAVLLAAGAVGLWIAGLAVGMW